MIRITEVSKAYASSRGLIPVVDGVSLSLDAGRSLALMGRSGSGKTTLLYLIGGLERPDSGQIFCLDQPVHSLTGRSLARFLRKEVGFLFQFGNLLSYLTVAENVAFPLRLNNVPVTECTKRVHELLEKIGLASAAPALPRELSGGEIQRVAFARAVAHRPGILLADEPTSSLDSASAYNLMDLMFRVGREEGRTTLVATHDPAVTALADRTLRLEDGKIAHATYDRADHSAGQES
jgi:putative ABC transport system ATP-binding protein